jgi:hypothetical protein
MKITKESLRRMIIQELTNDYIDYGGEEMVRSDFRTTNFVENIKRVMGLLDDMETNVRDDKTIGADELNNLKNVYLKILSEKIADINQTITKKSLPVTMPVMQGEPNEYKGKFARNMMMIVPLLVKMKEDVSSNAYYKKQDLEYFKNNHLDNLMRKIGFLEGAVDASLSGAFDEVE